MPTPIIAPFPASRLRRLRRTPAIRAMVSECDVTPANLIWPIFVTEVPGAEGEIASMPGVERLTLILEGEGAVDALFTPLRPELVVGIDDGGATLA